MRQLTRGSSTRRSSVLRTLSLVLALAAVAGLAFGTAGFSAMSADRGLAVNVTDDETAYLGYEPVADDVQGGEPTAVVEYRNQFAEDLGEFRVNVSVVDAGRTEATIRTVDAPDRLDEGAASAVDVTLGCPVEEDVTLLFDADGSGGGVSVSVDRVHTVTCVPGGPTVTGVKFSGAGNAQVETREADGEVSARVWVAEKPPQDAVTELSKVTLDTAEKLDTGAPVRSQIDPPPKNWTIVAVEFPDAGVAYLHPEWNAGAYDAPRSGSGVAYGDLPLTEDVLLRASATDGEVVVASSR